MKLTFNTRNPTEIANKNKSVDEMFLNFFIHFFNQLTSQIICQVSLNFALIKKSLNEYGKLPRNILSNVCVWFPPSFLHRSVAKPFFHHTESEGNLHVFSKEITALFHRRYFGAQEEHE